jgi:hypothetical protein
MKPFNLEECIAGKPVVTRGGRPFKFGAYNPDAADICKIVGWVGNISGEWHTCGTFLKGRDTWSDLFMASEKKEGWTYLLKGVRPDFPNIITTGPIFNTQDEAEREGQKRGEFFLTTAKIEREE